MRDRRFSGEYRQDIDPEWPARLLIGVFDGIQVQWLHDRGISMEEGLHQVLALLRVPQAES